MFLGSLICVLRDDREAILQEEPVVVSYLELTELRGCQPHYEGVEGPSEALQVVMGAPLASSGFEVPQFSSLGLM